MRSRRSHPYSKPPQLIEYILRRVCRRGDLVLDPFAGSGSSRVAAEKLGLDLVWAGCDIDPQFAETRPLMECAPPWKGRFTSAALTKTAARAVNSRIRNSALNGASGPPPTMCHGLALVRRPRKRPLPRDRLRRVRHRRMVPPPGREIAGQISLLEASLVQTAQGLLW